MKNLLLSFVFLFGIGISFSASAQTDDLQVNVVPNICDIDIVVTYFDGTSNVNTPPITVPSGTLWGFSTYMFNQSLTYVNIVSYQFSMSGTPTGANNVTYGSLNGAGPQSMNSGCNAGTVFEVSGTAIDNVDIR